MIDPLVSPDAFCKIAFCIFSISVLTADKTAGERRFTSSKHENAPLNTTPVSILDKSALSIAESQLKTIHGRPKRSAKNLMVSVLPEPAFPYARADMEQFKAVMRVA